VTSTQTEALETILVFHRLLENDLYSRVDALKRVAEAGGRHEPAVAELVAYLAAEVLPHAVAEEQTVYRAASAHPALTVVVSEMVSEHQSLALVTEQLADVTNADEAMGLAQQIVVLFSAHVRKENDVVLPALVVDDEVDVAQLLTQMHRLAKAAPQESPLPEDVRQANASTEAIQTPDPDAAVLSLLLQGMAALAQADQGDLACRLTASAWAALRRPRPDLAARVAATLHRLAHLASAEPVALRPRAAGQRLVDPALDVRSLAPAQRHRSIFAAYEALAPGAGFVLVNDHDPKPLRYQFEAEHAGEFTWDSLEAGPQVWRVRIGRPVRAGHTPDKTGGSENDAELELDVRSLAHGRRHESIFAAYEALVPGAGFVLVNDHDPKPLRYQFEAEHPGAFSWDYLEAGPQAWRVRIGRVLPAGSQ